MPVTFAHVFMYCIVSPFEHPFPMKTLILSALLLLTAAVQADQWYYQGKLHKGKIVKFSPDNTKVYVTSDWDSYHGSWQNVAELSTETRVWLKIATPKEKEQYEAAQKAAAADSERSAAMLAQSQERLAERRQAEQQAQTEAQKQALQQEIAALLRQQNELLKQQQQGNVNIIYAPGGIR